MRSPNDAEIQHDSAECQVILRHAAAEPDYSEDEESHTGATQCRSFSWEY